MLPRDTAVFIIYADLECLIERIDGFKNNPENWYEIKVDEYIPSGFSISAIPWCKTIETKDDVYRGENCIKKFCESLGEHAIEMINLKKKKWSY